MRLNYTSAIANISDGHIDSAVDTIRTMRAVRLADQCTVSRFAYLESMSITWADTERGRGPTGTAIRTGATQVNQNILTNPDMAPWREAALARGFQSSIALPLKGQSGVIGALTLYARECDAFNQGEVELLEELADGLAFGITTLRTSEVAPEKRTS